MTNMFALFRAADGAPGRHSQTAQHGAEGARLMPVRGSLTLPETLGG
jgi:hypothetical protein